MSRSQKKSALKPGLRTWAKAGDGIRSTGLLQDKPVGFFDLGSSTSRTLTSGHYAGTRAALQHNSICQRGVEVFGGDVIKQMGDGILAMFPDCVAAMGAALNILQTIKEHTDLSTKIGLTVGTIEILELGGHRDIYGTAVNRAARIQGMARPNQILIDGTFYSHIDGHFRDFTDIQISKSLTVCLRGIDDPEDSDEPTQLRELRIGAPEDAGIAELDQPWELHQLGRYTSRDQIQFVQQAKSEVIHLGLGLKSLTDLLFTVEPSRRQSDRIKGVIARGVTYKFYVVDPDQRYTQLYLADRDEPHYEEKIRTSVDLLRQLGKECNAAEFPGRVEVYKYKHVPYYHAIGVDIGEEGINPEGKMVVSNYLHALSRVNAPVLFFSHTSAPILFEKYWHSLRDLIANAERLF